MVKSTKRRTCKFCHKQFKPARRDQRYCKPSCRKQAYEMTEAATARKRKYETSLRGTIAQYKYDHSEAGKARRQRYTVKPKEKIYLYTWINGKGCISKEAKQLWKRMEKRRTHRNATTEAKDTAVREKILRNAEELGIRPKEACVLMEAEWTSRGVKPPWWFTWRYYATQQELNEQRIYEHEQKIQADAQQRGIPYSQAESEYKDAIVKEASGMALTRASFMGALNRGTGGKYTYEQLDQCMADRDAGFDYQWAGGQTWKEQKSRNGNTSSVSVAIPNTTDIPQAS